MNSSIKKVAIIVGHGCGDPGAECWNGFTEHGYNSMVSEMLKEENTGKEIKIFHRGKFGIMGVGASVVAWNPDLSIELHLNSFNKTAVGCEVLCLDGDEQSAILGRSFALIFTKIFGRKLRGDNGIKWIEKKDRGSVNLISCKHVKQKILVEPFFCDNPEEWIDPLTYSKFLVEWIRGL